MRKNANEIVFDEIIVLGTPALFTDWRVDRASVPTDMKMYEVRHADEDWGDPCATVTEFRSKYAGKED